MKKHLLLFISFLTISFMGAQVVGDRIVVDGVTYTITVLPEPGLNGQVNAGDADEIGQPSGDPATYSGTELATVVIPASVTYSTETYDVTGFELRAFAGNTTITSVDLSALDGAITNIAQQAFFACPALETVVLPTSVTSIGTATFQNCAALTTINLTNLINVGQSGLQGLTSIDQATFNAGIINVQAFGRRALRGNTQIERFELPSITSSGREMFQSCTSLNTIVFGPNLTGMASNTFDSFDVTSLKQIEMQATDPSLNTPPSIDYSGVTLYVPVGTRDDYNADLSAWKAAGFKAIIEGSAPTLSTNKVEQELGFSIFPNPTSGIVTIKNAQVRDAAITVYDLNGRTLLNKNMSNTESSIDISNLASGLYLIKVRSGASEFAKRILKQ